MNVVVLTGTDAQHAYVARALAATGLVTAVVQDRGRPRSQRQRLVSARRRFGLRGAVARAGVRGALSISGIAGARDRRTMQILGPPSLPASVPVHEVRGVNAVATQSLLRQLAPDILCVYGTSIVRDDTLALAGRIALNLHTGISPYYRGADCAFWPLHEGEPHMLGATVHECTSAVDGGAIFAVRRAVLEAADDVGAVFARCVFAGAGCYAEVLQAVVDGTARGVPQDLSQGREYRAAMRDGKAKRHVQHLLHRGLLTQFVRDGQPEKWSAQTRSQ